MKNALIAVALLGACATSEDPNGAYDGTLTLMQTGLSPRIVSVRALVNGQDDYIELREDGVEQTPVSCTFTMTSWDGSEVSFGCAPHDCNCYVNDVDLEVLTATGTLSGNMLTLSFTGEETLEEMPYTGEYVGALSSN